MDEALFFSRYIYTLTIKILFEIVKKKKKNTK